MALTVSLTGDWLESVGSKRAVNGKITFDSSYATGGETLTPANIGLGVIDRIEFNQGEDGYVFKYDYTNQKVLVYRSAGFTPEGTVAAPVFTGSALAAHRHNLHLNDADVVDGATTRINAGTNLLGANTGADILVAGVANTSGAGGIVDASAGTPAGTNSAPAFTGTAVAATALIEVANATDLSAVAVEFRATGR